MSPKDLVRLLPVHIADLVANHDLCSARSAEALKFEEAATLGLECIRNLFDALRHMVLEPMRPAVDRFGAINIHESPNPPNCISSKTRERTTCVTRAGRSAHDLEVQ